jgi:hypothetical protein
MMEYIKKEIIPVETGNKQVGFYKEELLKGEIEGISTHHMIIYKGNHLQISPDKGEIIIVLFTQGQGIIEDPTRIFDVQEIAVFIPDLNASSLIKASLSDIEFIQINMLLTYADKPFLRIFKKMYPYFMSYAQCKTYQEEIKSEKTVSRMLVPEQVVPRLSIGSVQTTGPDIIAAHQHPMLEQLFYGLKENSCNVHADGHETFFGERTLLHIPLGSNHGVRVDEGNTIHYMWMDFFRHQEDVSYITESHIINDE